MFKLALFRVAFTVLAIPFATPVGAIQFLSPSVSEGKQDDRVASELDSGAGGDTDLSRRLLNSLQTVVPFPIKGSEIEESLQSAIRKLVMDQTEEAIEQMTQLRTQQPELPPGSLLVAGMLFTTGDTAQGRVWLEKTAAEFPEYPTTWTGLARLAINEMRIADAIALLEKADRLIESGAWNEAQANLFRTEFLDSQVDVAIARQQLDKAREYLLQLRKQTPDNARIALRLAQVEFDLDNVDASVEYLVEARALTTELRVPEVIVAEWFMRKQDAAASEEWIKRAAGKYPENVDVMIDQARWLLQSEKLTEAAAVVTKAASAGGEPYVVQFLKGQLAFARRAYDVAEMHFESLTRLKPGDADATNMLALSLVESEEPTKQELALELAMVNQRQYPRSATAAATVGWIYFRLGRDKEAENVFQQVAATGKLEPASAYFMARFLQQRGESATAITLLNQALSNSGYFMFRAAARELLDSLSTEADAAKGESPETGGDGDGNPDKSR